MEPSDKRKKNNEARMKVYMNQKEEETWLQFEHHVINYHSLKHCHRTWHWSVTPEENLHNAGYINEYNKHRLERLAKYKEGINRHKDYGLDGLALDSNNIYYGLQAKYYTNNKVSANDIGTFQRVVLRMSKKNPLSKGYLYTSTDLVADLAEDIQCIGDIIHEKLSFETKDKRKLRHQKQLEEINAPFRPYQQEALKALDEETKSLSVINIFCGGGKTLISGHHLSKIKPNIIIAIAPLQISVDNLKTRLLPFLTGYESLLVDSDTGGTTDLEQVKSKLAENKPIIIFSTFDSFEKVISNVISSEDILRSFLLVDEVHNIVNNTSLCEIINEYKKGLLMSATIPEELYETVECELVYKYGMASAIKDSYCVDYNVWLPQVIKKDDTISVDIIVPDGFQKSDLCAKILFLVCGMLQTGSRRCIVYLRNREECKAFNKLFIQVCKEYHGIDSWAETIDCSVGLEKRKVIIEDFQKDTLDKSCLHIITSVRILDEAVDIVRCDSEFITYVGEKADDKRAVQRLQRGGRLDSSNLAKKNNLFIWADDYSPTLTMLSLLKESDPEFHTKLRILDGNYDSIHKKESIIMSAVQLGDLQKYVEVKCLSLIDYHKQNINNVKQFYETYKEPPKKYGKRLNESKFSCYLITNRQNKKKGLLSSELQNIIEKEWPWFSWDPISKIRDQKLQDIVNFYKLYKEEPRIHGKRINEHELCTYLRDKRKAKKNNKLSLSEEQKIRQYLPWFSFEPIKEGHSNMIDMIAEFYNKYGEAPNRLSSRENENKMVTYLDDRRKANNKNNLSEDIKKEIINKLPWFSWDPLWERHIEMINDIIIFYNKYNELPKQDSNREENEHSLGQWMGSRRTAKKNGKLSVELENEIKTKLPWLSWDPLWESHLKMINDIIIFYNKYNELPKQDSNREENEHSLGLWMGSRRTAKKNGYLTVELEKEINEKIPWFMWDPKTDNHKKTIKMLCEFYKLNNRTPIYCADKKENKLKCYIASRIIDKKQGKLSAELEKLIKDTCPWIKL